MKKPRRREKRFERTIKLGILKMINEYNGFGNGAIMVYRNKNEAIQDIGKYIKKGYIAFEIPTRDLPIHLIDNLGYGTAYALYFLKFKDRGEPSDVRGVINFDPLEDCEAFKCLEDIADGNPDLPWELCNFDFGNIGKRSIGSFIDEVLKHGGEEK